MAVTPDSNLPLFNQLSQEIKAVSNAILQLAKRFEGLEQGLDEINTQLRSLMEAEE